MYTLQFSRQQYFSFISLLDLPTYFLTPAYSVFVCLETMHAIQYKELKQTRRRRKRERYLKM